MFKTVKSRVIAGFSILAIAGASLAPLPAMAGSQNAAISNTQVNAASAVVNATGHGPVTVVQLGINVATNTIVQLGRHGDKTASIDNTQVNSASALVNKTGRGPVTVVQAGRNVAHNTIVQH
jgi:hypothetical protein